MKQPRPFSRLLMQKLLLVSFIALLLASFVTGLGFLGFFNGIIKSDLTQLQKSSIDEINDHLATGWTQKNIIELFHHLNQSRPNHFFSIIKAPTKELNEREKLPEDMYKILLKIEKHQTPVTDISLLKGTILGGIPIIFEQKCLPCHQSTAVVGEYAGTLLFKSPLSNYQLSLTSSTLFILLFLSSFLILTLMFLKRFLEQSIMLPLTRLTQKLRDIRLDENLNWQRTPHTLLELDEIDQVIHQNVEQFKHIFDKLDAIKVTEHETGFFLADHFSEALKFEIYRCERYERPFSLMTIKLYSIEDLDKTLNRSLTQKISAFSQLVRLHIRNSDMPFRISENLFAILAPEMEPEIAQKFQNELLRRFEDPETQAEAKLCFHIACGFASYPTDAIESKGLSRTALDRMAANNEANKTNG